MIPPTTSESGGSKTASGSGTEITDESPPDGAKKPNWGIAGEFAKYSAVIVIVAICINVIRKKLGHITWEQITEGLANVPPQQIAIALAVTTINFVVLTGYDWIAVHYLKKQLPLRKIMVGAIIGYAFSNIVGWMLGGTAVRYRLYSRWGFSFVEVLAFISILSVTFWLGMFMLAGVAFVLLPVQLPDEYMEHLHFSPRLYGYFFLICVGAYLCATIWIRKPIRIGTQYFAFPPPRLSLVQLSVSAADFALASLVLYLLLPHNTATYGTVLVSYLAAMIVTVILHVPGGFGVLELIVLELLTKDAAQPDTNLPVAVTCGILLFRVIYYIVPGIVALVLYLIEEMRSERQVK